MAAIRASCLALESSEWQPCSIQGTLHGSTWRRLSQRSRGLLRHPSLGCKQNSQRPASSRLIVPQCYWSKLDGNATSTWSDAHITEKGIQQARKANAFWAQEIATQKIPTPESYYTSPLDRCLATANLTFSGLKLPSCHPFIPEVKEVSRRPLRVKCLQSHCSR